MDLDIRSRLVSVPHRLGTSVIDWIDDNPLATAGGATAAIAGGYLYMLVKTQTTGGPTREQLATAVWNIAGARPVYLLAIVVGIGVLTRCRQ